MSDLARLVLHVVAAPWLPWSAERRVARLVATRLAPADLVGRIAARMRAAFVTSTPAEIDGLVRANVAQRWTEREIVWLWRLAWSARRRRALADRVEIHGLEHVSAALGRGRGAILVESHLGKRPLARAALQQAGVPVVQVHAVSHGGEATRLGGALRRLHRRLTRRAGVSVVEIVPGSLGYLRALGARLGRNEVIASAGLGTSGDKFVAVPALGGTLAVPTGIASLARATGAAVLPVFAWEDAAGRDHVTIESPLPPPAASDAGLAAWAGAYVGTLERWVRRHPTEWFWWFGAPDPAAMPATARRLEGVSGSE